MKRPRETAEEKKTEILSAIEELSVLFKSKPKPSSTTDLAGDQLAAVAACGCGCGCGGDHRQQAAASASPSCVPTRPFLSLCHLIIQILDKTGPTLGVLRQDVSRNIQRLERSLEADPIANSNLIEILKSESIKGNARKGDSCSRALLWLTRSLDLTAVMLQKLANDPGQSMEALVEESYKNTLKPWHGWISAAAYKVALKLLPDTKTFLNLLMANGQGLETLKDDITTLTSLLTSFLEDVYSILVRYLLCFCIPVFYTYRDPDPDFPESCG
ncbi:Glycolipid transfer protein 2-like protein [Drosera capensis]